MDAQAITVRLPKDVYERLRRAAFQERTSQAAIIIEAVTGKLDRPCHCLCGTVHRGQSDICTGNAETTVARWTPQDTSLGVPVCGPCSAAIVSAAGR